MFPRALIPNARLTSRQAAVLRTCSALLLGWLGGADAWAQIPAFPGAEGFGAYATGGRGGDVYYVNNLNNSGAGSFADAIATVPANGRTIVFGVSGYIHVNKTKLAKSKVTIAGQTAPGDGIGFKDGSFIIAGNDVIIRHARFRYGDQAAGGDCINIDNGVTNLMLDHISLAFSTDENISSFEQNPRPDLMTFQWSLNAWGVESHSCGGLWDLERVTTHHTLWAHNHTRNPKARPYGLLDWLNNVTFDWDIGFIMGDSTTPAPWKANVMGNYFICPPGNLRSVALEKARIDRNGNYNFTLHVASNLFDKNGNLLLDGVDYGYGIASGSYQVSNAPIVVAGARAPVVVDGPLTAYKKIVSRAGPLRLDAASSIPLRDEVDTILVSNLVTLKRNHVSHENQTGASNNGMGFLNSTVAPIDSDADGMPEHWEQTLGWNPGLQDHNTALASAGGVVSGLTFLPANTPAGYTRLEEYLHFLAIPHATIPRNTTEGLSALTTDLRKFTSGFNKAPVTFTVSHVTNGTVTLQPDGATAVFTPTPDFSGRARFDFTVTDGDGSSWTQTLGILVSAVGVPRDLKWKGDGSANVWDTNTLNWLKADAPAEFRMGDNVTFDDSGSSTPSVLLSGVLAPGGVIVNASQNYSLAGGGSLAGPMTFIKSGAGTLSISTPNTYSGETVIEGSEVILNPGGNVGAGQVTLQDGTLTAAYGATSQLWLGGKINAASGFTGTVNLSPRVTLNGLSGGGILNLNVSGTTFNYDRLNGGYGGFSGVLNISGTVSGARLTCNFNGGSFDGNLANAHVHLDNVTILGRQNSTGNTLRLGALTGTSTAVLGGSGYAGTHTCEIGARNLDTTFPGTITDGVSATLLRKVGNGSLTLTGHSTYSGATTVGGGVLIVNGSLGASAVTVASGGTLAGTGALSGPVIAQTGAFLSPGNAPGEAATLSVGSGLDLSGATLLFDLSSNPASGNDRLVMSGGTLIYRVPPAFFQFNLVDGILGQGTYTLITGGAGTSAPGSPMLTHNLPAGGRQTFSLQRSGGGSTDAFARLVVSGNPATLVWQGNNGGAWDQATTNWLHGGVPDRFYGFDAVVFDDSATSGGVVIAGTQQPLSVTVSNHIRSYGFSGGMLSGPMKFIKDGPGSLIVNNTNAHTGGTFLRGGLMTWVNNTVFGTSPLSLEGGTLAAASGDFLNPLVIDGVGGINASSVDHTYVKAPITGAGALHITLAGRILTYEHDLARFTGSIVLSGTGSFRFNQGGYTWGSPDILFDAGPSATLMTRALAPMTIELGALAGGPGSRLQASDKPDNPGSVETFFVGALNLDTDFDGRVTDGSTHPLELVKVGGGTLTLRGDNLYTGGTTLSGGTLRVSNTTGSGTGSGALTVAAGATLAGDGVVGGAAALADFGVLSPGSGIGTLTFGSDLVLGEFAVLEFDVGTSSDHVVVSGDLGLAGTLNLRDAGGWGPGEYTLFTYGGALIPGEVAIGARPGSHVCVLDLATSGVVKLIVSAPQFAVIQMAGTNLLLSGLGGQPGAMYRILSSSSAALPVVQWLPILTNQFDPEGAFDCVLPLEATQVSRFFTLVSP